MGKFACRRLLVYYGMSLTVCEVAQAVNAGYIFIQWCRFLHPVTVDALQKTNMRFTDALCTPQDDLI